MAQKPITGITPALSSCCRLGDQIISVNGVNLEDVTHHDAVQTLKNSGKDVELVNLSFSLSLLLSLPLSLFLSLPPSPLFSFYGTHLLLCFFKAGIVCSLTI